MYVPSPWATDQVEAVLPKAQQQGLGSIALISKDFPLQSSSHGLQWLAVIPAPIGDLESHELTFMSVTFAQGSATATLNVGTVDDTTVEEASTVTVRVSDGSGYTVAASGDTASGVVESEDLAPITAQFTQAQDEHDGSTFLLQFTFSHAPLLNYVTVRDALFDVTGGRIEYVRRLTWGNNLAWELRVKPDGFGDVTLTARATTDCEAAHGVCDAAGRRFDGALERTIQGPPTLSVADAEVEEAEGATLEFTVTISRSLDEAVTVTYATADGTATAGSDYRAANDTLTFAAGETAKTVSVAVLYNTHDEGSETLTLSLTSPSPSRVKLADADATGTITNTGPLPAAWTARFGRTVAEQVLDAVEGRMEAGPTAGLGGGSYGQESSQWFADQ